MIDEKPTASGEVCPHLGSANDPELRYLFANPIHVCLHSKSKGGISFEHQDSFCIVEKHVECPLYAHPNEKTDPKFIRKPETARTQKKRGKWLWISVVLLILILGGAGSILFFGEMEPQASTFFEITAVSETPSQTSTEPSQTSTPRPTLTATELPTKTLTPTTLPSNTPEPTNTEMAPPTPGPNLGTPFGDFVLHRVKTGESLAAIARIYEISSERITAANIVLESRGVWVGDILVIPLRSDQILEGFHFEYIFIEKKTDLTTLAETHSVAIESLREYNLLGPLDWVPAGRWLIIPVVGE